MSLLKHAKKLLAHAVNQAESLFHKATVTPSPHASVPAPTAPQATPVIPASLARTLAAQGASLEKLLVKPPSKMIANAAKADLASPTAVAFSADAAGLVRWHLPKPGRALQVWVDHAAAGGRNFVVAHLFGLGAAALDELRNLEQTSKQPVMKHFPDRSLEQAGIGGGIRGVLQGAGSLEKRAGDGPVLILIHGIFDFAFGVVFAPLLLRGDLLGKLHRQYNGRVFGFDHPTLSVGPLENANDLIDRLPPATPIDILCHSRGGLVTRMLLQHPACQRRLTEENIQIRNVIFMGAANEGSRLAEPGHLEDLLTTFTSMFQEAAPEDVTGIHLDLLVKAARVLLAPALDLPGIAALRPGNELIQKLSRASLPPGVQCTFICANFGNAVKPGLHAVESISDRVFGTALNDLVVPVDGMTKIGDTRPQKDRIETLDHEITPQGHLFHLNYLDSPKVRQHITRVLIGS